MTGCARDAKCPAHGGAASPVSEPPLGFELSPTDDLHLMLLMKDIRANL